MYWQIICLMKKKSDYIFDILNEASIHLIYYYIFCIYVDFKSILCNYVFIFPREIMLNNIQNT